MSAGLAIAAMSARIPTVGVRARAACLASRVAIAAPSSARDVGTNVDVSRFPHLSARRCVHAHHGRAGAGGRAAPSSPSRGFAASSRNSSDEDAAAARGSDASSSADADVRPTRGRRETDKHVLYRGPWLLPFRTLVRFKIFQLAGVGAASAPLSAALNNDPMSMTTCGAVAAVVGGSAACSLALQYYASRYVGELSLVRASPDSSTRDETLVRVSTMDFWGSRSDADVRVSQIAPPLQDLPRRAYRDIASQMFVPLEVRERARGRGGGTFVKQHVLSLRHGNLMDKKRLFQLLTGEALDALER